MEFMRKKKIIPMNSYNTYFCDDDDDGCEACEVVRVDVVVCQDLDVV